MKKSSIFILIAFAFVLLSFSITSAEDYPILDMIANKVIQKYQTSTCEQLWKQKNEPKSQKEQEVIQILKSDPKMREVFIDKVAAPVANKMFECGMIP